MRGGGTWCHHHDTIVGLRHLWNAANGPNDSRPVKTHKQTHTNKHTQTDRMALLDIGHSPADHDVVSCSRNVVSCTTGFHSHKGDHLHVSHSPDMQGYGLSNKSSVSILVRKNSSYPLCSSQVSAITVNLQYLWINDLLNDGINKFSTSVFNRGWSCISFSTSLEIHTN